MAAMDTLTDNFDAGYSALVWEELGNAAQVNPASGAVAISHPATAGIYNSLASVNTYDLTGSFALVRVSDYGNQALASHEVFFRASTADFANAVDFYINAGVLNFRKFVAGVQTILGSLTLNTTAHRWLRLREAGGTVFWETAPDPGTTWTNRFSVATPITITLLKAVMQCGSYAVEASGSQAVFDNFNVTPSVAAAMSTLVDNFDAGINASLWASGGGLIVAENNAVTINHTAAPQYTTLNSLGNYDLTGSYAYVQLKDAGNQALASHEIYFVLDPAGTGVNRLYFYITGGQVQTSKTVASVSTQVGSTATYSSSTHKWLRIREAGGTVFFDCSPDSVTWTNFSSTAAPFAVTNLQASMTCGNWATEATPSFAVFDNFNTPVTTESSRFFFAYKHRMGA